MWPFTRHGWTTALAPSVVDRRLHLPPQTVHIVAEREATEATAAAATVPVAAETVAAAAAASVSAADLESLVRETERPVAAVATVVAMGGGTE